MIVDLLIQQTALSVQGASIYIKHKDFPAKGLCEVSWLRDGVFDFIVANK